MSFAPIVSSFVVGTAPTVTIKRLIANQHPGSFTRRILMRTRPHWDILWLDGDTVPLPCHHPTGSNPVFVAGDPARYQLLIGRRR